MRSPLLIARATLVVGLVVGLAACNVSPDKRLLQYLNTQGFGNRYVGNAEEENYVAIGDTVQIQDSLHPDEVAGAGVVEIDGTILLPEVGAVHVAGYTRSEVESFLTEKYSQYYEETDISVQIQTKGKTYFVFGEVQRKGETPFTGDLTIFEAVMSATPDDNTANLGRVRLIRADPVQPFIIYVDIGDIIERGDSTYNVHVQERDIIFVPATLLAQLGYFVDDLLQPVKQVLSGLGGAFFGYNQGGYGRRRGAGNTAVLGGF